MEEIYDKREQFLNMVEDAFSYMNKVYNIQMNDRKDYCSFLFFGVKTYGPEFRQNSQRIQNNLQSFIDMLHTIDPNHNLSIGNAVFNMPISTLEDNTKLVSTLITDYNTYLDYYEAYILSK